MNNTDNDLGLQWKCNTFDAPLARADIINSGFMSDDQGDCTNGPAGNLFSRSSLLPGTTTHFDLLAPNTGQVDVEYQHHHEVWSNQIRLKPAQWSGMSSSPFSYNVFQCQVTYNSQSCPIQKTSLPLGIDAFGKSNADEFTYDFESINSAASAISSEIGASELIVSAESTSANTEISEDSQPDLATEAELVLKGLMLEYAQFWNNAVSAFMMDTLETLSRQELSELLATYQPEAVQRFSDILSVSISGPESTVENVDAVELEESVGLFLPLPANTTVASFESVEFVNTLNRAYYNVGKLYDPLFDDSATIALDEDANGAKNNGNGIDGSLSNAFQVLPNPFNDQLQLRVADATTFEEIRIVIHDVVGKVVFDRRIGASAQIILETEDLPVGMLIYSIYTDGNFVQSGKVLKAK